MLYSVRAVKRAIARIFQSISVIQASCPVNMCSSSLHQPILSSIPTQPIARETRSFAHRGPKYQLHMHLIPVPHCPIAPSPMAHRFFIQSVPKRNMLLTAIDTFPSLHQITTRCGNMKEMPEDLHEQAFGQCGLRCTVTVRRCARARDHLPN
jgi:hypothetical protein